MTFKDFRSSVLKIQQERFDSHTGHPLEAGIRRALYNEAKLGRLIALTEQVSYATAKRKGAAWARQLEKVKAARQRFEKMKAELHQNPPASQYSPTDRVDILRSSSVRNTPGV